MQSSHGDLACSLGVFSEVDLPNQLGILSFLRPCHGFPEQPHILQLCIGWDSSRLASTCASAIMTLKDVGFILSEIQ